MSRRPLCAPAFLLPLLTLLLVSTGCAERVAPPAAVTIPVFTDVNLHFTPDEPTRYDTDRVFARDNGRVMATVCELPGRIGPRRLVLKLALRPVPVDERNVADRWDRAGSVRLVQPGRDPVELCRFMTSYGGATDHEVDVTHLAPLLQGRCEFEIFLDTWVSPAWTASVALVSEPVPAGGVIVPAWASGAVFPDGGLTAESPRAEAVVDVPAGVRLLRVAAISTGHCTDGRDADEFESKDNVLYLDGVEVARWQPWRDDCGELRAVNPYCAKWTDGMWSSDYSRSGWCPGDVARPRFIDLPAVAPGPHVLAWEVEDIRPALPDDPEHHHGYWRVSAAVFGR
ncbi:MAG TPA: peptide-N-glycosidase F-related protein [Candidatus Krumholzibacteria bacterium]|nr:peptide-N-glycosidase F-related protein [Candidatus Krumholzibacteria bacterium]